MKSYSIYELKCPTCDLQYTQMISKSEEKLLIPCPSCDAALEKVRTLSGTELLSCVSSLGGG